MKHTHKKSLQMRITLITGGTMIFICMLLAVFILFNTQVWMIHPISGNMEKNIEDNSWESDNDGLKEIVEIEAGDQYYITQFYSAAFLGICIILIIGVFLIYWVIGLSLKPLKNLQEEIACIDENDLSKRIRNFPAVYEIDLLASSFNQMMMRIQRAFEREKEFSAGAAHELKTPLAVINTNIDVLNLSDSPTEEEYAETFVIIKRQTDRMKQLVDDLFSMCTMDDYEINDTVSIEKLMTEIADEQKPFMEEKGIQTTIEATDCFVKANSVMLRHALSNLIQNAIRYNVENGSIQISIATQPEHCIITVADTGIGISPKAAEHIFEPFYREDKSRSRKSGGAGLGLSITKNIITQHNGTLIYQPNQPRGSMFVVALPFVS